MKITLTKKVTLPHGKKVDKGLTLKVVNEKGLELIAVYYQHLNMPKNRG